MILFFDTETTGLPNYGLPTDHESQPHLVQLACLLTEHDGQERTAVSIVVDPLVPIPEAASRVHGITDDVAERCGVPVRVAAALFAELLDRATVLVAHNIEFDAAVMRSALRREAMSEKGFSFVEAVCTMTAAAPIVSLPPTAKMVAAGFHKPKPPRLAECCQHFFGEPLPGAHDAMVDVRACARVFRHLKALGAV